MLKQITTYLLVYLYRNREITVNGEEKIKIVLSVI